MKRVWPVALVGYSLVLSACGTASATGGVVGSLMISPQNSVLLVGVNRISIAVQDKNRQPVEDAIVTFDVQGSGGTFEHQLLQFVGHQYSDVPVYIGVAKFPQPGQFRLVANVTTRDGHADSGQAYVTVVATTSQLAVGARVPPVSQRIASDVGGQLNQIDSGVPPDQFHSATIADGLTQKRPMVLYFGEPGRCPSQTCGPTLGILQQLYADYGAQFLFEHVEIHDPASSNALNPAYVRFGLLSEPWIYFVNAHGVVADRFEGPVTLNQLREAAHGTLAGNVPAVDID